MANKLFSAASIKRFLWHCFSVVAFLLVVAGASAMWYSGTIDAQHSLQDGRRLVLHLGTGELEGWQANLPKPVVEEPKDGPVETIDDHMDADKPEETAGEHKDDAHKTDGHDELKEETADDKAADAQGAEHSKEDTKEATEHKDDKAHESKPDAAHDAKETDKSVEEEPAEKESHDKADDAYGADKKAEAEDEGADAIVPSVTAVRGVNDALTEKSKDGLLPRIGKDGTKPWKYYAKAAQFKGDYPVVAIIVTGVGTSKSLTEQALKLPQNITLSFSPYARNVESWATAARVTGHEIMLDLPLQPVDYPASDPGPYGLLVDAKPTVNDKKLEWLLSRFGAFTGVLTPLNEGFIQDTMSFAALAESVGKRGLIFALSRPVVKDNAKKVIEDSKSPILVADVLLDEDLTEDAIRTRIATLQEMAKEKGFAIGLAQNYPVTLDLLKDLPEQLEKEGVVLMPLSYIAKKRFN